QLASIRELIKNTFLHIVFEGEKMKKQYLIYLLVFYLGSSCCYSQDYIFVHGWLGSGSSRNNSGVEDLIESMDYTRILKPSLIGNQSASTQSLNLRNYLINNNVNNGVAISFSMGGMTTRYHLRRQYDLGQSSRVGYNFTIGSPHYGTAVANNISLASRILLVGAAS